MSFTAQKMEFSIKDFFSKCDQIRRKHLLKKSLMKNSIFCAVHVTYWQFRETQWDMGKAPYLVKMFKYAW